MATEAVKADVAQALQGLSESEQKEVAYAANPDLFPKGDGGRTRIWMTLLIVLGAVAVIALAGSIYLSVKDKDGTAVIAVTSAVVAGLLALFASPPK